MYINECEVHGRPWTWTTGASGTNGYVGVAQIVVRAAYNNSPIQFLIAQRNILSIVRVNIQFNSVNGLDPTVDHFTYNGAVTQNRYFLLKTATSTWELYVQKTEAYDLIDVIDVLIGHYASEHMTITPISKMLTTAPTWTNSATKETD